MASLAVVFEGSRARSHDTVSADTTASAAIFVGEFGFIRAEPSARLYVTRALAVRPRHLQRNEWQLGISSGGPKRLAFGAFEPIRVTENERQLPGVGGDGLNGKNWARSCRRSHLNAIVIRDSTMGRIPVREDGAGLP